MSEPKAELLVLDVHGVVLTNPLLTFLDQLAVCTGQSPSQVRTRWRDELRTPAWTGQLGEDELWRQLAGDHHGRRWRDLLESQYALGPAARHVERWSRHIPIWLLSNHRSDWLVPRLERFGLTGNFERVIVSDMIGAAKPDEAAYQDVINHVGVPALSLFVDDQSRNVEAAARLGICTIHAHWDSSWIAAIDNALGLAWKPEIGADF